MKIETCLKCIHNEVCLYLWKFSFNGTSSRKELYASPNVERHCGHYKKGGKRRNIEEAMAQYFYEEAEK